ncbi:MAG: hypothetical protein J3Q66DRAFT_336560 [Benniella sp.]|nr:MAG: hypothetical protein J3Q66DRAFT_297465 [Benniella sp.]KAK3820214.1 MAG: hypothetical protein J3Q66DRAFT_336560 [Benniella sp.]
MAAAGTGSNPDMEIENDNKPTNHPKKNEFDLGADFIAFEDSDDEDEPSKTGRPPHKGATNSYFDRPTTEFHGGKRRRPVDEDEDPDEGPMTGPPPGCPWMGHRNYSKMASVPIMLTQELWDFVDYISPTKEEHQIQEYVVRLVRKTVKDLWSNADVVVFGSFDTMLYLPTSDLDIVLLRDGGFNKLDLNRLASHLRRSGIANEVTVISKAKVPLVKFKESITGIPVDISFNLTNGIDSGQVISTYINEIPALRPLTMLVKYFLMIKNHNEVYKGGIGSYTTVIMILSFLQMHPQIQVGNIDPMDNLGVLLIEFFELYGLCFNYTRVGLTVRDNGSYFEKKDMPTNHRSGRSGQAQKLLLSCIDPNDPTNDTAKGSYSLQKIREVFAGAYGALTQAVQNRDRELFMDDKRVSSSHVQFDDRNRVAADSKQKSSGLHRSTQVSLIKEVYQVPMHIIRHRQKIAKVFLDGTYQVMFGDPIVHSLDLKTV